MLGISRSATVPEIRSAYRRLAREVHPDVDPSPDATERFIAIKAAHDEMIRVWEDGGPGPDEPKRAEWGSSYVRPDPGHMGPALDPYDVEVPPKDIWRTLLWVTGIGVWFAVMGGGLVMCEQMKPRPPVPEQSGR